MNENKKTPKTISLSVPKGYEVEFKHFSEQPNKSRYIWDLVRQDLKNKDENYQILEIVKNAMQNLTPNQTQNQVNNSMKPSTAVNNFNNDKRKKSALNILQD